MFEGLMLKWAGSGALDFVIKQVPQSPETEKPTIAAASVVAPAQGNVAIQILPS